MRKSIITIIVFFIIFLILIVYIAVLNAGLSSQTIQKSEKTRIITLPHINQFKIYPGFGERCFYLAVEDQNTAEVKGWELDMNQSKLIINDMTNSDLVVVNWKNPPKYLLNDGKPLDAIFLNGESHLIIPEELKNQKFNVHVFWKGVP